METQYYRVNVNTKQNIQTENDKEKWIAPELDENKEKEKHVHTHRNMLMLHRKHKYYYTQCRFYVY